MNSEIILKTQQGALRDNNPPLSGSSDVAGHRVHRIWEPATPGTGRTGSHCHRSPYHLPPTVPPSSSSTSSKTRGLSLPAPAPRTLSAATNGLQSRLYVPSEL